MDYRKILLIIFFLFFCAKSFSAVFVVTSNADSGPGTLRDALTQAAANGSATQDIIQFNLADTSQTGRTIIISSDLPNLSSNLVIDASTQPGAKFGMSDAKIKLIARITNINYNITLTTCFNINSAQNIEIYGFLFDCINATSIATYNVHSIDCRQATNLIIGAPGKGNILKTVAGIALYYQNENTDSTYNKNVKISSNIFGISENNVSLLDTLGTSVYALRVVNLTLGGLTPAEGNKFDAPVDIDESGNSSSNIHTGNLLVANNSFGTDIAGTKNFTNSRLGSELFINCYYLSLAQVSNNLFVGYTDLGFDVNCFFKLTGNKFGTDITGTQILGTSQFQVVLGYCGGGGIIGGTNPGDGNIFAGAYYQAGGNGAVVLDIGSPGVELVGNSFKCNNTDMPYDLSLFGSNAYYATITNRQTNLISGTATPNSRVDLYYSLTCDHCEPEQQFTSINADANGNWIYNGTLSNNNVIASSTYKGTTSEFTTLQFANQPTDVKIRMVCNGQNGSITGLNANSNSASFTWYDVNNNVVSNTKDLINVPAGIYHLIINDGYCSVSSGQFEIKDASNQINVSNEIINPSSCGQANGSIIGITADPTSSFSWANNAGSVVGYYQDLNGIPAGSYTLTVTTADGSCSQTLAPIIIKNVSGPNIDQNNAAIQSTNCGQSTGSITGITATGTGTLNYIWLNGTQQQVGTGIDLLNQPAGTYQLQVTDNSQCGPVYSTNIQIPETNGITMDESAVQTTLAACGKDVGSITGIKVTGASEYYWIYGNNKFVTTTPDLLNVAAGDYTLTATNSYGCIKTSQVYHITNPPPTVYPTYNVQTASPCFGKTNGSITVSVDGLATAERWVDYQGATIGTAPQLSNIAAGAYQLYLTDKNGCETSYGIYNLSEIPQLSISAGSELVTNDQCTLKKGSVTNIQVTGGVQPYTYSWQDAGNNTISSSIDLTGVGEGTYTINVNDASGCGAVAAVYTVQNQDNIIPSPLVSDVQVCSPGDVLLQVNNTSKTYTYRLYDTPTAITPLAEQPNGVFKVSVKENASYYISELTGSCESNRAEVKVSVGLSSVDIANTFTPNGDGINDYWKIKGIENYPTALVQVFNRYGQKVFESKGYAQPFDGTFNGKAVPVGVYYFIINLSINCNLLTGSLTIIR